MEALTQEPVALLALAQDLAARLRHANAALEAATALDLKGRLARLLLTESKEGHRLVQLTQTEMAGRLGASRGKVNRRLHAWRADGLIDMNRAGVRLSRPDRLKEAAYGGDQTND